MIAWKDPANGAGLVLRRLQYGNRIETFLTCLYLDVFALFIS